MMKIVIIGGSGLIGTRLATKLREKGHEVNAASPASGVNTITGEGLAEALAGAQVVVDVSNSPSFEETAVLDFFETSGRNLLAAEARARVKHHVALSIVGVDRPQANGYFRAKLAQENLIKKSGMPYSIVRSTQFFEFLSGIAASGASADSIQLSPAAFQPIAADDVAAAMADTTLGKPINGTIEIAGPERSSLAEFVQRYLVKIQDLRKVTPDIHARYFGAELNDQSLVPGPKPRIGLINFETWFANQPKKK